jgi:hypothetical protein
MTPEQPAVNTTALESHVKSSASWFYWIAALTMIGVVVELCGTDFSFILSLCVPTVFAAVAHDSHWSATGNAIVIVSSLIVCGVFAWIGLRAGKGSRAAFMIGMVFYGIDTLIYLGFKQWLGAIGHAYALYRLSIGFGLAGTLAAARKAPAPAPDLVETTAEEAPAAPVGPE